MEPKPAPTDFKGILKHLGPGLIITATIVGSGELTTLLGVLKCGVLELPLIAGDQEGIHFGAYFSCLH